MIVNNFTRNWMSPICLKKIRLKKQVYFERVKVLLGCIVIKINILFRPSRAVAPGWTIFVK